MGKLIDITGQRFGCWIVLAIHPERRRYGKDGHAVCVLWDCRCICDEERAVLSSNLRRGLSKSCGFTAHEATRKRNTKHGHAVRGQHTRAYNTWQHMKQRCLNPNNKDYPAYGGRGIGIDDQDWCSDYQAYYADVLDPPPGMSLDRVNNDLGYGPSNCRWAPPSVQRANQRPPRKRKGRRADIAKIRAYAAALTRRKRQ